MAYAGAWLPKWDAPLFGEARVKIADAKRMNATTKATPESVSVPPWMLTSTWLQRTIPLGTST